MAPTTTASTAPGGAGASRPARSTQTGTVEPAEG